MIIRDEGPGDEAAIGAVTAAAFEGMPYSDQTEPRIVERLRAAKAMTLSLVAEEDGEIVGHVAFSPVALSNGEEGWYGVGPLSVRPDRQRQGVGSALMREGIRRMTALGAAGCVLVGEPDFYRRFGFVQATRLSVPQVPSANFLVLPLRAAEPLGIVAFHPGFFGDAA